MDKDTQPNILSLIEEILNNIDRRGGLLCTLGYYYAIIIRFTFLLLYYNIIIILIYFSIIRYPCNLFN